MTSSVGHEECYEAGARATTDSAHSELVEVVHISDSASMTMINKTFLVLGMGMNPH